jgi:error-prone DNA polymerase
MLRAPREGEEIVADYASLGLSLRRHPLELLEKQLAPLRDLRLADLAQAGNGQRLAVVGLVITRQHPASANGTVFLTLEDETGSANLIVWPQLVQRQRAEVVGARLLRAAGKITREGESVHLIAERLGDHSRLLGDLLTPSRDFR